ncbi:MAG: prephenate dehydrogenase/arogenate dehydrogenase family protein [Salinisphaera sp.]|nr:prephenate dehydrogenase/arogenate dehydrogenase family protein [Salinisphaera sp.]MDN5939732.1 prephenate dehydrogenase/arogenate dehydrogenase family protein [Salinisphaera sp.]
MINRLAVIGVGLIGGSTALALRAAGAVTEVVGAGRSRVNMERAKALGIVDRIADSAADAVAGADAVLVAVPVGAMRAVFAEIAPWLAPDAVVTDAGSTKASVLVDARVALGAAFPRFVAAHPIAGTEHSGADAAFATLLRGRRVILSPTPETDPAANARVRALWQATGAQVSAMDGARHDQLLAATSHLPHVLAYVLVDSLTRMPDSEDLLAVAAGGFTDFTRVASSNPEMWTDIVAANSEALLALIDRYQNDLSALRDAIAQGEQETIRDCFQRAKMARDRFVAP